MLLVAAAATAMSLLVCLGAGRLGVGPFGVVVTEHQPQLVIFDPVADPAHLWVLVAWDKDGYCSGQFTVAASETATEVRVGVVTSREHRRGDCAGLGSDGTAAASLQLASPLGDRAVVRDADGVRLPVRDVWTPHPSAAPTPTP